MQIQTNLFNVFILPQELYKGNFQKNLIFIPSFPSFYDMAKQTHKGKRKKKGFFDTEKAVRYGHGLKTKAVERNVIEDKRSPFFNPQRAITKLARAGMKPGEISKFFQEKKISPPKDFYNMPANDHLFYRSIKAQQEVPERLKGAFKDLQSFRWQCKLKKRIEVAKDFLPAKEFTEYKEAVSVPYYQTTLKERELMKKVTMETIKRRRAFRG